MTKSPAPLTLEHLRKWWYSDLHLVLPLDTFTRVVRETEALHGITDGSELQSPAPPSMGELAEAFREAEKARQAKANEPPHPMRRKGDKPQPPYLEIALAAGAVLLLVAVVVRPFW